MRHFLFLFCLFFSTSSIAQFYNNHFQIDGAGGFSPFIHSSTELPNGNIAYNMTVYDSTALNPGNLSIFNPNSSVKTGTTLFLLRPDNSIAWSHVWNPINNSSLDRIVSYSALSDAQGNIYLSGFYQGDVDLDPTVGTHLCTPALTNSLSAFVVKFDINGNYLWSRNFESADTLYASAIITTSNLSANGNILFAGRFTASINFGTNVSSPQVYNSPNNIDKPFILSLDSNGNFVQLLTNTVGTATTNTSHSINSFKINNAGEAFIIYHLSDSLDVDFTTTSTYYTNPTQYVVAKYDNNFQLVWSKALDLNIYSAFVDTSNASHIYIYGDYKNTVTLSDNTMTTSAGLEDVYYEKWDASGNCTWAKTLSGTQSDFIAGIKEYNNRLFLLYSHIGTINTNTGVNDTSISSTSTNVLLSHLDLNGNHIRTSAIPSIGGAFVQRSGLSLHGNLLNISLRSNTPTDIDPSTNQLQIAPLWNTLRYFSVVKWGINAPLNQSSFNKSEKIQVFPNPNNGTFNLELKDDYLIEIHSLTGEVVLSMQGGKGSNKVHLDNVSAGTYLMKCSNKKNILSSIITLHE